MVYSHTYAQQRNELIRKFCKQKNIAVVVGLMSRRLSVRQTLRQTLIRNHRSVVQETFGQIKEITKRSLRSVWTVKRKQQISDVSAIDKGTLKATYILYSCVIHTYTQRHSISGSGVEKDFNLVDKFTRGKYQVHYYCKYNFIIYH